MTRVRKKDDSAEVRKVTWVGLGWNAALSVAKFVVGVVGNSQALVADAIHSASDFVTDVAVIVGSHFWNSPPDAEHPYGHRRFETLITIGIGLAVAAVGLGIGYKAVLALLAGEATHPEMSVAVMALASIVVKEILFRYTRNAGRKIRSQVLEANAWHHRSDALSSIGTAVGIGGAIFLGQRWTVLDPLASVVVGAFIVKVAVDLLRNGIGDLMEHSLPDAVENEILQLVASLPGVVEPHDLRTRRIGNHYAIELHILMDGDISLRQAHDKASEVENLLRAHYGEETHIAVHGSLRAHRLSAVKSFNTILIAGSIFNEFLNASISLGFAV